MPAPAAQDNEQSLYQPQAVAPQRRGRLLRRFGDGFGGRLDNGWSWIRRPADRSTFGISGGRFRFEVQSAELHLGRRPRASVLTRPAPGRDFVVQTKVSFNLPAEGCCYNFPQAGLVLYRSHDAYVKLTHTSAFETRQTTWAKEVPRGFTRYGGTVVGPPAEDTGLRIVAETRGRRMVFTAYTRQGGRPWVRGGTWVHNRLRSNLRIGLVSMGALGPSRFTAQFHSVRVWTLER
jgi:arabinan endo-1,5-alpha-L-arabinosidase